MQGTPQETTQPVLILDGLRKSFRGKTALTGVSFAVPRASLTVILGCAGAGKTTTLRLIAGLDQPDAGRVVIGGRDVSGWEPKDRDIAMILDNLALYPNRTGYANIASPLLIRGEPPEEIERKVTEMATMLKVAHTLQRLPKTMSGGERQRIALGRALIRTPSLFLLDEPLSSLDAMLRIELRAELKRLQREQGHSFLLATPDFTEAMAVADTVVMLRQGRVVQIARPQDLYDDPVDREAATFVGAPQINLAAASHVPGEGGGQILFAATRIAVPPHLRDGVASGPRDFELGIRPENLALADPGGAQIRARLADIEPLGLKSVLTVRNEAAELRVLVESAETHALTLNQAVGLNLTNTPKLLAFDPSSGQRLRP